MNPSGDAAEQVVRMSLEGMEVAARISGQGAEKLGVKLFAVLKEEQKIKGKARLTTMLKSGRELKVFSVQDKDLKTFAQEAKRYGVLYCVLKDKNSPAATVDIIARAEDASKIQRITEKFKLMTVEKNAVNPQKGATEKDPLSAPGSERTDLSNTFHQGTPRASVREKLKSCRERSESVKTAKDKGKEQVQTLAKELAKLSKENVKQGR